MPDHLYFFFLHRMTITIMPLTETQAKVVQQYFHDDAPILFFVLNEDGVVIALNRFTQELLGDSAIGRGFKELLVDFNNLFELKKYTCNSQAQHLLTISVPNDLPRSYTFSFHRVQDSILVFGKSDAEELESLRKELLSANGELNNLTRTLHKKNAQLEQLNALKNQFLGMAAHDLRKPISVILNYNEFLLDEVALELKEEHRSFLGKIESSATFMKRLVDDFLDISAIEAGRLHLNILKVDPVEVLEKSLVLARIQAEKKGIELDVSVDPGLPEIPLDADKIEQAMGNLLGNAIEHSTSGTCVSIKLQKIEEKVCFSVKDRGVGMDRKAMEKLFVPFAKTGSRKTGGEKSTGLGLTITRKIIEAHQGEVYAKSEEGLGTTFSIFLPLERNNGK